MQLSGMGEYMVRLDLAATAVAKDVGIGLLCFNVCSPGDQATAAAANLDTAHILLCVNPNFDLCKNFSDFSLIYVFQSVIICP